MRLEHRPRRVRTPAHDDALIVAARAGCPNCQAPTHPEAIVVARYRGADTIACLACCAPEALLDPPAA